MRTMIFWRVGVVCTGVTCTCARRDRFVGLRPPRDDEKNNMLCVGVSVPAFRKMVL